MPRLYKLVLLFLLFDILVALLFPIAAAFQSHRLPALVTLFFFLAILLTAYAYLWRFGYLGKITPPDRKSSSNRRP